MEWMILPFKRYAEFSGRSRRLEYWMFQLFNIIVIFALCIPLIIDISINGGSSGSADPFEDVGALGMLSFGLMGLYVLAAFIPGIAVTVRRFHDIGLTGWAYLGLILAGIIPLIGFIASIAAFVITVLPGNQGSNKYGADPKNPYEEDIFA
jgi:uncharacterized membrane protein YhaH (DUF805 family)